MYLYVGKLFTSTNRVCVERLTVTMTMELFGEAGQVTIETELPPWHGWAVFLY